MTIRPLLGPNGRIPILIRDDDINFFTKPEMIESIYSKVWSQGFKVSLSVIPLQKGINDLCVPPEVRKNGKCYSIADNKSLIEYLKNKIKVNQIEVLQHGIYHTYNKFKRGEFGTNSQSSSRVLRGRDLLLSLFGTEPKFFVPPGEDISNENMKLVSELGMIPICRDTIVDKFLRSQYLPSIMKNLVFNLLIGKGPNYSESNLPLMKPVNLYWRNLYIGWSLPLNRLVKLGSSESVSNLTQFMIHTCSALRTPVCILNHYHSYFFDWNSSITKKELFKTWNSVMKSFDQLEPSWKIDFATLVDRFRKVDGIRTVKTGSKITIESATAVKDYSFINSVAMEDTSFGSLDKDTNIFTIRLIEPRKRIVLYEKT